VQSRLRGFPYYENYIDLTRIELAAIHAVIPKLPHQIAFIGSGPLPLSSLCLYQSINSGDTVLKSRVLNIDHNEEAITLSASLCEKLGAEGEGMEFVCALAGAPTQSLEKFDVVYLAALVGATQEEKEELLVAVVAQMRDGALLVVRSANGLRTLLYPVS
jgi:nicotianamine synthase